MSEMEMEGLRDEGPETVEKTGLGTLSASAQRNKARKQSYIKMAMKQLGLDQDEAERLIEEKGLDFFILHFGSPRKTEDMEEDMNVLKSSLLGKKKKESMISQIESLE